MSFKPPSMGYFVMAAGAEKNNILIALSFKVIFLCVFTATCKLLNRIFDKRYLVTRPLQKIKNDVFFLFVQ